MASGFSGMISAMIQNNDFSIEGLIYLHIEVNRHDILNDRREKLNKVKNLQAPLRISFVGEEGSDEGGVKNEYFQLITKAIFNPYLDMFLPKHKQGIKSLLAYDAFETIVLEAEQEEENVENEIFVQQMYKGEE